MANAADMHEVLSTGHWGIPTGWSTMDYTDSEKDRLVKHSSALNSQPLHNLIPSHNPLILRRRILKEKDNPSTRGCGGRKCLSGFLLFHPMVEKDCQKIFPL